MKNIKILFTWTTYLLFAFFLFPQLSEAQIKITEIMYDLEGTDSGREWIEVQNTGNASIDLTNWRLFEAETNHKINKVTESIIAPLSYAVIADDIQKFLIDNPDFSGLTFDSAFSLSNNGETIAIKDSDLIESDSFSYTPSLGGAGNGDTIQKNSAGSWQAGAPSPGKAFEEANPAGSDPSTTSPMTNEDPSSHSSPVPMTIEYGPPDLEVSAGRDRLGYVGIPLQFEASVKSSKNIPPSNAVYSSWSMGDGSKVYGRSVSHTYDFPGEYIVVLNSESGGAKSASKAKIKIIEPKLKIKRANGEFVEIENQDKNELNLGGFSLEAESVRFNIPEDTLIIPGSSIRLPNSVTRISGSRGPLKIINQKNKIWDSVSFENAQLAGGAIILLPDGMDSQKLLERFKEALKK